MDLQDEALKEKFETILEPTRIAIAFSAEANNSKTLPLLLRYEATHRRNYEKAFQKLLQLQAIRKRDEAEAAVADETPNEPVESIAPAPILQNEPNSERGEQRAPTPPAPRSPLAEELRTDP